MIIISIILILITSFLKSILIPSPIDEVLNFENYQKIMFYSIINNAFHYASIIILGISSYKKLSNLNILKKQNKYDYFVDDDIDE